MKKLWNRTRSRSRRQSETRPTTVKSSPSKEHLATPPVPALPRTSQSMQRTMGIDHDGRTRPVLVGVSRPGELTSRPGTAGSLQHAVSLAADRSSQEFSKGHTRTKSPRYVDIFSASRTRSITSAYNEEVAARNLDIKVTQIDQKRDYVPSSKYQEEVAVRNSYRSSSEAPRTSTDRNHRSWISSGTESGPSRGHTPHHSWSKTTQDPSNRPPSASGPKAATSHQPLPAVPDEPTLSSAGVSTTDNPFATMPREYGVSTGSIGAVNARLAGYNLSRSEVSQPRPAEYLSTRSSSRMSATSSHTPVINLAHRTIMDLTASDDEDEQPQNASGQATNPAAQTPATVQTVQRQQQQLQQSLPPTSKQVDFADSRVESEFPAAQSAPVQVIAQMEPSTQPEPKLKQQSSSFSTISTLASLPPAMRPEEPVPNKAQIVARRDHVAAQLASVPAANRLSTVNEMETEVEDTTGESTPTSPEPIMKTAKPIARVGTDIRGPNAPTNNLSVSSSASESLQASPKNVHSSPDSLRSADFINPSSAFGVRTRDFAVTPSKATTRVEREANTKAKVSKTGTSTGEVDSAASIAKYESSFDEEAFRKKQEQARAALVKLQQSLNEEFLPPPREQPATRPNRMNGVGQRRVPAQRTASDPHGPVAPSSIFAKDGEHGVNGTDSYDVNLGREAPAPTVSRRPPLNSHASGSSGSTARVNARGPGRQPLQQSQANVAPRARSVDKKGKGKEREIDIALFGLQQVAAEIAGPPRASSAHGRYAHSSLSDRRAGSAAGGYDRAVNGYGPGHMEVKRPYTSTAHHNSIPPSPGDVSLSHFPVAPHPHQRDTASPAPNVPQSPPRAYGHQPTDNITERDFATERLKRRGSTTSQASQMTSTSQYSIPFHMIPERGSSMRDIMVREDDAE
jgi:hypothetical protein